MLLVVTAACVGLPAAAYAGAGSGAAAFDTSSAVSGKGALAIALEDAGLAKSKVSGIEIENEKRVFEVEFVKKKDGTEYNYDISKSGGVILEKEVDFVYNRNKSKAKVGKKAALKKVAAFSGIKGLVAKGAACTYKYKKKEGVYKVKFAHKGYKYEYKLLAPTGKVIEWEMERIGK